MSEPLVILTWTTISTAVFHTLIPDHWLPFVLVARTEGWGARRTAVLTAASALLHVVFSIALGLGAFALGRSAEAAAGVGGSIGKIAAGFLIFFGALYSLYFLWKGGHQHFFGMHPHHAPDVPHPASTPHPHDLDEPAHSVPASTSVPVAAGMKFSGLVTAVPARRGRLGAWALAGIVGFNPCVLIIPYIYLAGSMGALALATVAAAFAVSTIACMVGVTVIGLKGTARLESPFLMRYGEAVSGALIALTGLAGLLVGE